MKKPAQKYVFGLYNREGDCFGWYDTPEEAKADVWGPLFQDRKVKGRVVKGHTIRAYRLLTRAEERASRSSFPSTAH